MLQKQNAQINKSEILERLSDGIWEWNLSDDEVYVSDSLKERLGYLKDEIPNEKYKLMELVHHDDFIGVKATIGKYFKNNSSQFTFEYRLKTKDSRFKFFLVGGEIIYDTNGKPVYMVGMHKDISDKKGLQESLYKTEKYYRNIFYKNKAVMLMIDSQTINITDANEEACRFYGYSKEQLKSMNIKEIEIMPEGNKRRKIMEELRKIKKTGYGQVTLTHRIADGSTREVEVYISPIETEGKLYYHCIIHDVTKQLKARELFISSERKYKKLFNSMSDGVFLVGLSEKGKPSKVLDVNKAACKNFGYTKAEFLKMTLEDVEHTKSFREVIQKMPKIFKKKYSRFELDIEKKDGSVISVEFTTHMFKLDGEYVILGISRDMTVHKLAEKALIDSEERYKTLIKSFPDAAFLHGEEVVEYTNDKGVKLLGCDCSEDIIKEPVWKFIPQKDIERAKKNLVDAYKLKTNIPLAEQKIIRKDGRIIDVEMSSIVINYNGKETIFTAMRDITDRKKIEKQLQRTMEENRKLLRKTIENEKIKTDFFANISHELKTPLNILLGSIQLIQSVHIEEIDCPKINISKKCMKMMKQNCYRLLRLVNNLIDITKLDAKYLTLDFRNYNIVSVVEEITMSVAEYLKNKGITLIFDTEIEEKITACDIDKIERILLNLLSNSIKYTEVGGSIFVNIYDNKDKITISVKDTGIGISKDKHKYIFERFSQGDSLLTRKREGSGIGLSLVKSLVEAHGGNITVDSEVGIGSEFKIELPVKVIEDNLIIYSELASTADDKVERINIEFADIYS